MKYLVLIYSNPDQWEHPLYLRDRRFHALPPEERAAIVEQAEALRREIQQSGELVAGMALGPPSSARTVRVRNGVTLVTDGPFAEAKEHLAGFNLLDCESAERAAELAARIPDARFAAVEVRPLVD